MRALLLILATFAIVALTGQRISDEYFGIIKPSHETYAGRREFPAPIIRLGEIFNSNGGYVAEFNDVRDQLIRRNQPVNIGNCASSCTMLLSVPHACVYPWSQIMFHGARSVATRQLDPIGTAALFDRVPARIRAHLLNPMLGYDQTVSGRQLIAQGLMPACR